MGASKSVVSSFWYKLNLHLGWCKGPIDAVTEIRGGDRIAWQGRQETSGIITINQPDLYGGESAEGGIDGDFEVMMGEPDQMPNSYLAAAFGDAQPGYRGRATILSRGAKIGAGNPYPKPLYFKLERIYKGWDNDVCWYPEKAAVPLIEDFVELLDGGWEYKVETFSEPNTVWSDFEIPTDGWTLGGELPWHTGDAEWPSMRSNIWIRRRLNVNAVGVQVNLAADNGCVLFVDGVQVGTSNPTNADIPSNQFNPVHYTFGATGIVTVVGKAYAEVLASDDSGNIIDVTFDSLGGTSAINPAHVLYDSITSRRENGGMEEPIARINDASFRAAADQLHLEGFGICCTWYGGESAEQFQQRICNVIGGCISQSRLDGQYYLDLLRAVDDPDSLPTITDDDILDWEDEPAIPPESINQIQVQWFDPNTREERITTPVQALGAIEDAGGVLADVRQYYEIPVESLALRVAQRDLQAASSALRKFTFTCTRKAFDLRPGLQIRLLCPKRGFADVIVVIGDIDYGDFANDEISIIALQDVFSLPDSVFVDPQSGMGAAGNNTPANIGDAIIMESPYVAIAAAATPADMDALSEDSGFVLVGAKLPVNGLNYQLATKVAGESYETYGYGYYAPTALVVEGSVLDDAVPETDFTLAEPKLLDQVTVGSWAAWGNEIVRVDAIDPTALTVTLGRGCGDTMPQAHDANSIIYFIGDWYASDAREYVDGETVSAKLMNRTSQKQIPLDTATAISITMDSRQARPYPPAKVRVDGTPRPASVTGSFVVTWAHRDRIGQADQLLDSEDASFGPEPTVRYALQLYDDDTDTLIVEKLDIGAATATCDLASDANVRIVLWTISDLGESREQYEHTFVFTAAGGVDGITAATYTPPTWVIDGNGG